MPDVKPKLPSKMMGKNSGQMTTPMGGKEAFADPMPRPAHNIGGMQSLKNDIGEKSGFQTNFSDYIDKKGTPYGEAAKFNMMPPGMDISNQENSDIREMPLKQIIDLGYPGDGGFASRDVPETE